MRTTRGAKEVASQALTHSQIGLRMHSVLINGAVGVVSTLGGEPSSVGGLTIRNRRIVAIDVLAHPERIAQLDLTVLDN